MKKFIAFLCVLVIICVGYLCKERLLSAYAKSFEKEVLKEPISLTLKDNEFVISTKSKQSYEGVLILGGNPLIRLNSAITLYKSG